MSKPVNERAPKPACEDAARLAAVKVAGCGQRILWLDVLRVVASMAVVLVHVSGEAYGRFTIPPTGEWWLANVMNGSSRAAVAIFAMISGALIKPGDAVLFTFYRRKLLRFLPVIVSWTLAYALYDMVVKKLAFGEVCLQFITQGQVFLHLWYLSMFSFLLVLTPFLAKLRFAAACSARAWLFLAGLAVGFVGLEWVLRLASQAMGGVFSYWTRTFMEFIPYFMLGSAFSEPWAKCNARLCGYALVTALAACWTANYIACRYFGIVSDFMPLSNASPLVLAVAVSMFLWVRATWDRCQASPRWLAQLGECALGVYLIHPVFLWLFQRPLRGSGMDLLSGWWMPLTALAAYACSWLFTHTVRRFPLGRRIC